MAKVATKRTTSNGTPASNGHLVRTSEFRDIPARPLEFLGDDLVAEAVTLAKSSDEAARTLFAATLVPVGDDEQQEHVSATDVWLAGALVQRVAHALLLPTRERWERLRAAARAVADVGDQNHTIRDACAAMDRARERYRADDADKAAIARALRLRLSRFDVRFAAASDEQVLEALSATKGGAPLRLSWLTRATGALGATVDPDGRDDGGREQNRLSAALAATRKQLQYKR